MSEVKVTVKTDEFEIDLPCKMEVSHNNLHFKDCRVANVTGYDSGCSRPWIDENNVCWKYARPAPKPKMAAWDIEDFRKAWEDNMIFKNDGIEFKITAFRFVENETTTMFIRDLWYNIPEFIEIFRKQDGSKLEKEA